MVQLLLFALCVALAGASMFTVGRYLKTHRRDHAVTAGSFVAAFLLAVGAWYVLTGLPEPVSAYGSLAAIIVGLIGLLAGFLLPLKTLRITYEDYASHIQSLTYLSAEARDNLTASINAEYAIGAAPVYTLVDFREIKRKVGDHFFVGTDKFVLAALNVVRQSNSSLK